MSVFPPRHLNPLCFYVSEREMRDEGVNDDVDNNDDTSRTTYHPHLPEAEIEIRRRGTVHSHEPCEFKE